MGNGGIKMGYLCPKCGREVSTSHYRSHVFTCGKTHRDYADQDAERRMGA